METTNHKMKVVILEIKDGNQEGVVETLMSDQLKEDLGHDLSHRKIRGWTEFKNQKRQTLMSNLKAQVTLSLQIKKDHLKVDLSKDTITMRKVIMVIEIDMRSEGQGEDIHTGQNLENEDLHVLEVQIKQKIKGLTQKTQKDKIFKVNSISNS